MFNFTALSVVGVFGIDALEERIEDLFVGSESLPSKPAMLELDHEVDEKQSGEVKNIATNQTQQETDGQKKKDVKVKLFEMNLSVFEDSVKEMNEKQPEVSLEMKKTLMLVERSKAEIRKLTQRKEKMSRSPERKQFIERRFGCSQRDSGCLWGCLSRIKRGRYGQIVVGS
ncbi:hypothetical protein DY000_02027204 [Brassica cretica]|uniref:Uncharacterized protein n=1 Tax=Brassica cretica TaxID=69181 RepID=A0ABQ7ECK4_BRACR|nr:hypothetical protein DY000_02027204 [Brassica cretica]